MMVIKGRESPMNHLVNGHRTEKQTNEVCIKLNKREQFLTA